VSLLASTCTIVPHRYPIQFFAAIEVIEYHCGLSSHDAGHGRLGRRPKSMRVVRVLLRVAVVSCTMVLAYAVPKLSLIIALFGAVFGGMIELILPPMLFLCDSNNPKRSSLIEGS
jgi:amino acid permease